MFKFKAMDKFIFYFTLLVVVCNKGLQCKYFEDKKTDETRIVGGNETTIEMYPYQAYLLVFDGTNYYQCGGSIISKHYIVTAAHCLQGMKNIFVRIGSTNSNYGGSLYQSTSFYSHLLYNNRTHDYDVGIVKIEAGMKLDGTKAKAIELVDVGYDPKENVSMVITGWGTTEESGSISTTLRVTQVPVVSRSQCKKKFKNLTSRMFCAGFLNGGKDSCQGDSGGPAVSISGNKLAGITSHGIGCARPNIPGVYTLLGNLELNADGLTPGNKLRELRKGH